MAALLGPWPACPLVYEINARVWLRELSLRSGRPVTLSNVPDEELERVARHGFHALWLMGVWTTGPEPIACACAHAELQKEYRQILPDFKPEDVAGSPYAITAYEVSPNLGGPAALATFRERLTRHGLRLMLDVVFNHTARDHQLVLEKPELYIQGTAEDLAREPNAFFKTSGGRILAHGRDPYFPPWTDTAQINYGQQAGRDAMKAELERVATQCDGIRADMAMLLLPEVLERVWGARLGQNWNKKSFWKEIISEFKVSFPNFLFLAESYWNLEKKLQDEGFDFTYDKGLYDRLRQNDPKSIRQYLQGPLAFQKHCARFVENHDEPRAASAFGAPRARSAAAVTFFVPGLKLFHDGQLEGRRVRVPVQLNRRAPEKEDIETALFYEKLLAVLQDPIFQSGDFGLRDVNSAGWGDSSNDSLVALSWTPPNHAPSPNGGNNSRNRYLGYLVVVNLNPWRAYGRVPLPAANFESGKQYLFLDRLDGKRYERTGSELINPGLYIALEAHQLHLLEVTAK
jgi:glycosidase